MIFPSSRSLSDVIYDCFLFQFARVSRYLSICSPHLFCILGVFNKSIFFRLDRICEDCYSLFREVELHSLCKWVSCSSCCSYRSARSSERFLRWLRKKLNYPVSSCLTSRNAYPIMADPRLRSDSESSPRRTGCGGIDSICIFGDSHRIPFSALKLRSPSQISPYRGQARCKLF